MSKQSLLYGDNQIISRYHEITVHKKVENSMAVLGFHGMEALKGHAFIHFISSVFL